jgi:hypothetical protein
MIKKSHINKDGSVCYTVLSSHKLEKIALFRTVHLITFKATIFVAAYKPYTGHWYAWDPETGKELATFSSDFFEAHISILNIGSLEETPTISKEDI